MQDYPGAGVTFKRWVIAAGAAAIGLWALLDNGLTGLLSVGLLGLVMLASLRLGRAKRRRGKGLDTFNPPGAGPTDYQRYHDPAYKDIYPENFFNDDNVLRSSGK